MDKNHRPEPPIGGDRLGGIAKILRPFRGRRLKEYVWILISGLWITALALGYTGLLKYARSVETSFSPLDLIYRTLQLVTLESGSLQGPIPWELEVARFALPALAAYTALQALALLFREQAQLLRLLFIRDHIVICGLSRKGLMLASNLLEGARTAVIIELDEDNDSIEQLRLRGAVVLAGDATDPEVLHRAGVHKARYLIAVTDDDGTNAEIAMQAQDLVKPLERDPLTCIIHMVDPQLCELLREKEISGQTFTSIRLELFNAFERGARLLLEQYSPFNLVAESPDSPPRILILGAGRLGESLIRQASYAWYSKYSGSNKPLPITLIDLQAERKWEALRVRHPHLTEACQVRPLTMDVTSPRFYEADFLSDSEGKDVDIVYICFDNDSLGVNVGLTLLRLTKGRDIPIVVRMMEEHGLASLLGEAAEEGSTFHRLHAFGLLDKTCTPELLFGGMHELLARAVHQEYVSNQLDQGFTKEDLPTLVPWEQLPEETKEANRQFADHIGVKLSAIGHGIEPLRDWDAIDYAFDEEDIETMACMEHRRWYEEMRKQGWSYGLERDRNRKTNPDIVPWSELPEAEKEKNRSFIRDLPRLLTKAGFQVYRLTKDPRRRDG
jgi:hypothetical protein